MSIQNPRAVLRAPYPIPPVSPPLSPACRTALQALAFGAQGAQRASARYLGYAAAGENPSAARWRGLAQAQFGQFDLLLRLLRTDSAAPDLPLRQALTIEQAQAEAWRALLPALDPACVPLAERLLADSVHRVSLLRLEAANQSAGSSL